MSKKIMKRRGMFNFLVSFLGKTAITAHYLTLIRPIFKDFEQSLTLLVWVVQWWAGRGVIRILAEVAFFAKLN